MGKTLLKYNNTTRNVDKENIRYLLSDSACKGNNEQTYLYIKVYKMCQIILI